MAAVLSAAPALMRRELLLAARRRGELLTPPCFFALVACLFPMGLGADPALLRATAPGVLWVAALLATLLALPRLFAPDQADGTLEQLLLAPQPLVLMVATKVAAHWLFCGLPLVLLTPLLALQYGLPAGAVAVACAGLLLGTPALSLLGTLGAALTLGARGSHVLLAVLVLPLFVPVLIFGAGALDAQLQGLDPSPHLKLLGAVLAVASVLAPWGGAAALRLTLD
jgi:heme exporter protein B